MSNKELTDLAVTRRVMAELDRRAVEDYGIPALVLMENAGTRAFDALERLSPGRPAPVRVFCGRGNNGGDGFVVARHAHNAGHAVVVRILGERDRIRPDSEPGVNLVCLDRMGIDVRELRDEDDVEDAVGDLAPETITVDALFGTGLRGEVRGLVRTLIERLNAAPGTKLALDIPSGLDGTTGEVLGVAFRADRTVTFALPKTGLVRGSGPAVCGELTVAPISIPRREIERVTAGS